MDGAFIRRLVIVFVALVFGTAVVVPITLDLMHDPLPDGIHIAVGESWEYRPETNIPAAIHIETDSDAFSMDGEGVVRFIPAGDGIYSVRIVAESTRPAQEAVQEVDFVVGYEYGETRPMFLLIPTLYFVGLVVWISRPWRRAGGEGMTIGGGGGAGPSIAGGLRSGGFRRR